MSHSLKNTWIMILSILAMLMSSFVSSAPFMVKNSLSSSDSQVTVRHHSSSSVDRSDYLEPSGASYGSQQEIDCHSGNGGPQPDSPLATDNSHCDDFADACCISVCSSVSYPTEVAYSLSSLSSTLALHHSIKIGVKVSRIQSLLRPPSA